MTKLGNYQCNQTCPGNPLQFCGNPKIQAVSLTNVETLIEERDGHTDCLDFHRLGIQPSQNECLTLMNDDKQIIECCYNNLINTPAGVS